MNFSDFFPKPNYLNLPAVGFDISDQSLKYVKLRRDKKGIRLAVFGKKSFPAGIIEVGQIKKPDELNRFLKDFREELKNEYLIAALPEEKAFIGAIRLPQMKEEEIRGSLELQLEEHIPLQAEEAIFDYEIIQSSVKENYIDVSFTAVPSVLAESYRNVLKNAGFVPLAFETEPHALVRALVRPEEKDTQMILDFGQTRTSFIINSGRKIEMTSTTKVAGEALDLVLAKEFSISQEEGNNLKKEKGLSPPLLDVISQIKNEAEKHLNYWKTYIESHNTESFGKEIEKIVLCGGDSNLKGFPEYLSRELHLEVKMGNPWINITDFENYIPEIEFRESLMYATAVGLALRTV